MILRLFCNEKVTDLRLGDRDSYSLGKGATSSFVVACDSLKDVHLICERDGQRWKAVCKGEVLYQDKAVGAITLINGMHLVLDQKDDVYLIAIDDRIPETKISLAGQKEIEIGRTSQSALTFRERSVSTHHAVISREGKDYYITDTNSTNGTYVNSKLTVRSKLNVGDEIILESNRIIFCGRYLDVFSFNTQLNGGLKEYDGTEPDSAFEDRIDFQRSPRLERVIDNETVHIENPPSIGAKPEINWLTTLLPAITTIGASVIMGFFSSRASMMYMAPLSLIGVVVTFINYKSQTKKYAVSSQERIKKYNEHLENICRKVEEKQAEQLQALRSADPDINACFSIVEDCRKELWERKPEDQDFVSIRIGSGKTESAISISVPQKSLSLQEDELLKKAWSVADDHRYVLGAPILCDIHDNQVCGIVGDHDSVKELIKNMIVQYTTQHYYNEATAAAIIDSSDAADMRWISRLPHFMDEERKNAFVASSKNEAEGLLKDLNDTLKARKVEFESAGSYGSKPVILPYALLFIMQPSYLAIDNPVNEFLFRRNDLGIGTIICAETIAQLPKECNLIIEVSQGKGCIYNRNNIANKSEFECDSQQGYDFDAFASNMYRIWCNEGNRTGLIPDRYSFYEMYGVEKVDQLNISRMWAETNCIKSLSVPIGIAAGNETVYLDLHESAHGPHGLVAGTTGSGKSELLQTYIISMALKFSPHEVGFVLIDFKGGGMANQFASLPHLLGTITNIDNEEINRSLASIKAELVRRQKAFADAGVNSIEKYIEKYRKKQVDVPIPHLIIIVDEFAELRSEYPEFINELVSASRIGRSLGVHLILATQKPSGQVTDQIWSNSKFQLCLKVATREDSSDVIKSPAAFNIKEPGRAYLRVGNNEVFELFQSAYSGQKTAGGKTQLDEVVAYVHDYCEKQGIEKLSSICLPPLEKIIPYQQSQPEGDDIIADIGIYDAPELQTQGVYSVNLTQSNLIIIGSPQKGKTNLLQLIIRNLCSKYSPDEVNIYVLDFASTILRNFEALNHVGGVVTAGQDEKCENLFKLLLEEISRRKVAFAKLGVSSHRAYREAGYKDLPHILVVMDNFLAFSEIYPDQEEQLRSICAEGISAGITLAIANPQTSGFGYRYMMNFASRIGLYCNDSGEYNALFDSSRLFVANIPGRALARMGEDVVQIQGFLSFDGEKEIERITEIREFIEVTNKNNAGKKAKLIPVVPEIITRQILQQMGYDMSVKNHQIPFGLDYSSMQLVSLDLLKQGLLAISGEEEENRTNAVRVILNALGNNILDNMTQAYIADGDMNLEDYSSSGFVREYTNYHDEAAEMIRNVSEIMQQRKEESPSPDDLKKMPLILLVLCGEDLVSQIVKDSKISELILNMIKDMRKYRCFVLISDLENTKIPSYNPPQILKQIRDSNSWLLFDDIANASLIEASLKIKKMFEREIRSGDGYLFIGGKIRKIRVVTNN